MRRITALIALAVALLFVGARDVGAEGAPPPPPPPYYDIAFCPQGMSGQLGFRFALGRTYVARDMSGAVVSWGQIQSNDWVVPVALTQPSGGLWVSIEGVTTFTERDAWWM